MNKEDSNFRIKNEECRMKDGVLLILHSQFCILHWRR
jgi:hypothetical protein